MAAAEADEGALAQVAAEGADLPTTTREPEVVPPSEPSPAVAAAPDEPHVRQPRRRRLDVQREAQAQAKPPRLIETAGPDPGTPLSEVRLTVGVLIGVHGIDGDLKMRIETDDIEHLLTIRRLYLGNESTARRVQRMHFHSGTLLVKLAGVDTPEAGLELRGQVVRIAGSDARPLPEGEYRLYQLIGLRVVDEAGTPLGTVVDLLETGANDVFVITPAEGEGETLLPYIADVVLSIDPAAGQMIVRPPVYYGDE